MDTIPLANRNVFLVGAITHVPEKEYPNHIYFLMQTANMLRFRYGLNPSFALLDNEVWLNEKPRHKRAAECYRVDQACVDWAGLVIAELTVSSTGTGQELERASQNGTPIILMAKGDVRKALTPETTYYTERADGKIEQHTIKRGSGSLSLMVEGNPTVVRPPIIYSGEGKEGRSDALRKLDQMLRQRFMLKPITERIEAALQLDAVRLNGLRAERAIKGPMKERPPSEEEVRLEAEMKRLQKMRDMADSLLTFSPSRFDPRQYEEAFGFMRRLPLADVERGLDKPTHMDIRPTPHRNAPRK
ncbi:MAG: hypothetical protein V1875_05525 [Candidatus Altiarchaeota archaeon]